MILNIPNNLDGKTRRNLIRYKTIVYAMEKFNKDKKKACDWLGCSYRTLNNIIRSDMPLKALYYIDRTDIALLKRIGIALKHGRDVKNSLMYQYADDKKKRIVDNFIEEYQYGKEQSSKPSCKS